MRKDFWKWHTIKSVLHNDRPRPYFKEREVWFGHLGENVGYEQDGKGAEFLRPFIVIKKFNNDLFWGIPLTTQIKPGHPYYFTFTFRNGVLNSAILSQLRLLDAKRLKYKAGQLPTDTFMALKTQIRRLLV